MTNFETSSDFQLVVVQSWVVC